MKRILFTLLFLICLNYANPVQANVFTDLHNNIVAKKQLRHDVKDVKKVLKLQDIYSAKYDLDGLKTIYDDSFVSSDGFSKETYFTLIKDTWKSYPDITYTTEIKGVEVKDNTATVKVVETSTATTSQIEDGVTIFGELHSQSCGEYYLKKNKDKWIFTGEKVFNEKSFLKYGDSRFVDMDLVSPQSVSAGEYYTASLKVDLPENAFAIASISRDNITYPQGKSDEVFRRIPDDNILERMFTANSDGKNEYNVASVGMSKSRILPNGRIQVYLAGLAFIMTRVNVEAQDAK